MPRASVTTSNNGISTTYEGVWLSEVLKKAGVPLGAALTTLTVVQLKK